MARTEQKSGVLGLDPNLDQKTNPFLPTAEMYQLQGWYTQEALSLTKRAGFQPLNAIVLAEGTIPASFIWIYEYLNSAAVTAKLAATRTKFYVYDTPAANSWNELSLTAAGGAARTGGIDDIIDAKTYNDQIYIGNGVDINLRYDGGQTPSPLLYRMGIMRPNSAPTASQSVTASGNLTDGVYSYKVTFVNRLGHESNPSPVSGNVTVDAAHKQVSLTTIPTKCYDPITAYTDTQVTARNIYRTAVNGGLWILLDTIADNTTTTYTDNLADTALTFAIEEFAYGVAPIFSMIEAYQGHAFMAGDPAFKSSISFSYPDIPGAVDSNDFRDLDPNDGDVITGLKSFQNMIVATKNNSIWNGTGTDRFTFSFDKRVAAVGSASNASIVEIPGKNTLAFISPTRRFYFYDGSNAIPAGTSVEPVLRALNASQISRVSGATAPALNQVRWIVPTEANGESRLIIWYDYVQDKWGTTDISNTPANVCASMHDDAGLIKFYIGGIKTISGDGGGFVYVADEGGTDAGATISSEVMDRGHPEAGEAENNHSFSHLFVWFKPTIGALLDVYVHKNDPDNTPELIGQIDCGAASGQAHLHFNKTARRLYVHLVESTKTQGLVIRGWRLYFKDIGQHNAP
jgi:hypothetical protein